MIFSWKHRNHAKSYFFVSPLCALALLLTLSTHQDRAMASPLADKIAAYCNQALTNPEHPLAQHLKPWVLDTEVQFSSDYHRLRDELIGAYLDAHLLKKPRDHQIVSRVKESIRQGTTWTSPQYSLEDHQYRRDWAELASASQEASPRNRERLAKEWDDLNQYYLIAFNEGTREIHIPLFFDRRRLSFPELDAALDIVIQHESQHLIDYFLNPVNRYIQTGSALLEVLTGLYTPAEALNDYIIESRAIGAQWEYVTRIPEANRVILLEKYRARQADLTAQLTQFDQDSARLNDENVSPDDAAAFNELLTFFRAITPEVFENNTERSVLEVAVFSLERAHLPKAEFISQISVLHGYHLNQFITRIGFR